MASKIFVDTNVLLTFYFSELEPFEECEAFLQRLKREGVELWISGQVIREFYLQATHSGTFEAPQDTEPVIRIVESLSAVFHIADESRETRELLPHLLREYQVRSKLTHDTNILATMLAHDIDTICSLDSDFERFGDRVTILRPQADPA